MTERIYARISMSLLLDEWWWEVREPNGRLYGYGYSMDRAKAKSDAVEKAKELKP